MLTKILNIQLQKKNVQTPNHYVCNYVATKFTLLLEALYKKIKSSTILNTGVELHEYELTL